MLTVGFFKINTKNYIYEIFLNNSKRSLSHKKSPTRVFLPLELITIKLGRLKYDVTSLNLHQSRLNSSLKVFFPCTVLISIMWELILMI